MIQHAFSPSEVQRYRTEGCIVVPSLFDGRELQQVQTTIEAITREALAGGDFTAILELEPQAVEGRPVARRIYDPFERHEVFRSLATDPRILDRVESLIGPDIDLQHSKLNMKPGRVGSVVEWHQDLAYFPHTNDDLVTLLIYLDDTDEQNGCLQVLPRCHDRFFDHTAPDGTFAGMITEDLSHGSAGPPVPLSAPAGSAIFMHCMTPHSSLPNRSERSRRTLIFEYRAGDSYPIYFGEMVPKAEAKARQLRGRRAAFARFGGPAPLIPRMPGLVQSLYQLQSDTKAKAPVPTL